MSFKKLFIMPETLCFLQWEGRLGAIPSSPMILWSQANQSLFCQHYWNSCNWNNFLPGLYYPFGNCYVVFLKHRHSLLLSQQTITIFQGLWTPESTPRTELTASWNPALLEGFQISSRKPTSHHIGVSIFQRTKVTSMFFNPRTLGCQSPDSRLLSPATKVVSPPETILTPTRANPQSLSSSGIVHPIVQEDLLNL